MWQCQQKNLVPEWPSGLSNRFRETSSVFDPSECKRFSVKREREVEDSKRSERKDKMNKNNKFERLEESELVQEPMSHNFF